jgi:hypothetical protein
VRPSLTVVPSGLVIHANSEMSEHRITVLCNDRPFRIRKVLGSPLVDAREFAGREGKRQDLNLKLDLRRAPRNRAVNIVIETDHSDQPTVSLSVLVLEASKGKQP